MSRVHRLLGLLTLAMLVACSTTPYGQHPRLLHADVQTVGRSQLTADGWQVTWPAVAWRTAFTGSSIGIDSQDRAGYHVEIDGLVQTPVPATPTRLTTWYRGLAAGRHVIEIIRMAPTARAPGTFFGFALEAGGRWLPMPPAPHRQLLVLGDSGVTGYGDLSPSVDCPDDVLPFTDASQSYPVIAARTLHADWQLNARDGIGLVRNWQGIWPGTNYGTYAARALQSDPSSIYKDAHWHPQVAVVALGGNDLATPLKADEPWTDASLREAVTVALHELISGLRQTLGPQALIIVMTDPSTDNPAGQIFAAEVAGRGAAGDQRIFLLPLPPLERTACFWHPSLASHRLVGDQLAQFIQAHHGFEDSNTSVP